MDAQLWERLLALSLVVARLPLRLIFIWKELRVSFQAKLYFEKDYSLFSIEKEEFHIASKYSTKIPLAEQHELLVPMIEHLHEPES